MTRPGRFALFLPPEGEVIALDVAPELASWDKAGSPGQVRLEKFLRHVETRVPPTRWPDGAAAIHLHVGLRAGVDLLKDHDLDNYLTPLVSRFRDRPLSSVWGTKAIGGASSLRISDARLDNGNSTAGWSFVSARPSGSAASAGWKHDVYEQVRAAVHGATRGALELQVSFRVGPGREWYNLWKQSIDALGPILGIADPRKPFSPEDGRIVRLGLHRTLDPGLGHAVELGVWWRDADGVTSERRSPVERPMVAPVAAPPAIRLAPRGSSATDRSTALGDSGPVEVFDSNDVGYLNWVEAHPMGYVLNCERSANPAYLKLHRSWCRFVRVLQRGQSTWTAGTYIKVCSQRSEALEAWLQGRRGGRLDDACHCPRAPGL